MAVETGITEFDQLINTSPVLPYNIVINETSNDINVADESFSESFWVNFQDARFMPGYVSVFKTLKGTSEKIEFKIKNDHIIPEFDTIKFWFAKKLKSKKFRVSAKVTISNGKIIETIATSRHISQITEEMIESIKYQRTMALTSPPRIEMPDKSLFTAEDIFSRFEDEENGLNAFNQSEDEILRLLLENSKIRNRQQLAYLAAKKQSESHKLRYTLHPQFGFLFLVEGKENNHFIWELLNSNATYIWSTDKNDSIEMQYKSIEDLINKIRISGRDNYRRTFRQYTTGDGIVFHYIEHENIKSSLVDCFPKWKQRIDERLAC